MSNSPGSDARLLPNSFSKSANLTVPSQQPPAGKRLAAEPGQRPKSDRLAPQVLALVAKGRSYRLIGREVGLSKNTVAEIVKRRRATAAQTT